ncbi:FumA C-terminus/TtdB family hydratase beta subunit [Mesosutterella sp. OilRF-GAM-744-9]|uniref:FumA C-terminus/TtdB family hydratase beta subunit n=1 Tax=Mesosutterella porci TaxID=2915351 RepID=A0ABS9MNV1_9BURK|nr:FumA C-terminus/TtdB family hydratase beta subunit [Mesosutterella sp. oilRF-744-WT-GAM-9]MCG5030019.1 FumA C-terminus/TtdB family hydratase beta subunit [Mesosutterella sp. oilRF-744-WT-GAM-9]MCI6530826.1 FumA C-terminus/TtdB family hydratase beta subunit [Mesosutterella sp.]
MATYELTLPVDDATIEKLHVGDIIYLNGQVCTARDIAHLKLRELAEEGKPFPEDLRGGAIFHAGPVMKKDAQGNWHLSVIGPTTSIRMEPHADFVGAQGVKILIGKGGMGPGTRAALQKYKQVYVQACPGCAVVLAAGIVGSKAPHWFEHGMPEAMWPLQAKHFGPFLVTMDSYGKSRYDEIHEHEQKVEEEILAKLK